MITYGERDYYVKFVEWMFHVLSCGKVLVGSPERAVFIFFV
jgi:hypothetical protein